MRSGFINPIAIALVIAPIETHDSAA